MNLETHKLETRTENYIRKLYALDRDSNFSLINAGENHTYRIVNDGDKYVLRQYRTNRYRLDAIQAELEWISVLNDHLLVPAVVPNKLGERVTSFQDENGTTDFFVLFDWVEGVTIEQPKESDYETLGRLMGSIHNVSDEIGKSVPKTWSGWKRAKYNETSIIHDPLHRLLNAPFLSIEDKDRCTKVAETLLLLSKKYDPSDYGFVHGDLHFGNILQAEKGWYCLDFDESGFGYRSFDIGVPRLHLIATGNLNQMWPFFISGYGNSLSQETIRIGTSLRIFYMAGKIPTRLDIESIGKQPETFIKRYLHFIEGELF